MEENALNWLKLILQKTECSMSTHDFNITVWTFQCVNKNTETEHKEEKH